MSKLRPISALAIFMACFFSCQTKTDKPEYSGMDLSDKAYIIRDKNTKSASLEIKVDTEWSLYAGNTVETINFTKPVAKGKTSGTFPIEGIPTLSRSYFQLVTTEGKAILAERQLPIAGGYNYRDLGGYKTINGQYIKWGKIFRSDDLYNLTDEDLAYLSSIPIISIVDFRSLAEIRKMPDKIPYSVKENYVFSIIPGNMGALISEGISKKTPEEYVETVKDIYRVLVTDTIALNQYRRVFNVLKDKNDVPLMFHCSAGKDRVGVALALIMYALGVDEKTIMQDYLFSGFCLKDKYKVIINKSPEILPLFEAREEYLNSTIDEINKNYGSMDNFLINVLQADIPALREMYLVK